MKKYILFSAVAALVITSCDTLDRKSKSDYDDSVIFSNETLTRYALNAIYDAYATMSSYRADVFIHYGANTDVEVKDYQRNERNDIGRYIMDPSWSQWNSAETTYLFAGNFLGIEQANLAIRGLREYGNIDNNPVMAAMYGEALTVRALLYTTLMNVYGEVPARFEPVNESTIYLPKADKDILYKHLLEDLEEAVRYMAVFDKEKLTVCPGRACAEALYARLALYSCGWSLRPETGKVNTGTAGTVRKSDDPYFDPSVLYPKALEMLQDIIDNGGYKLAEDYEQYWKDVCSQHNVDYGGETIFALPFSQQRGQWMYANAIPNTLASLGGGGGHHRLSPSLFFRYDPEDIRRNITCCPYKFSELGQAYSPNASTWFIGKFRYDWMGDHPLKKMNGEDGVKPVYIRLADVYLMASEIANELGDLPGAKDYMKPILMRAFSGNEAKVTEYLDAYVDKEGFLQAVKDQRAFEFAGELLRRMDLIRWGELKKALDEDKDRLTRLKNRSDEFKWLKDYVFYRFAENGCDLEIYGLNPGETKAKSGGGWKTKNSFFSSMDARLFDVYLMNPDEKMWRPIPQAVINGSNGYLVNDYGYDSTR